MDLQGPVTIWAADCYQSRLARLADRDCDVTIDEPKHGLRERIKIRHCTKRFVASFIFLSPIFLSKVQGDANGKWQSSALNHLRKLL